MGSGWAWLITILTAASLVIGIANTIWTWMSKGGAAIAGKLNRHEAKLIDHDRRIQSVESELKHLPSRSDVHQLAQQLTRLTTELEGFARDLGAVDRAVERIERHLMGEKS